MALSGARYVVVEASDEIVAIISLRERATISGSNLPIDMKIVWAGSVNTLNQIGTAIATFFEER